MAEEVAISYWAGKAATKIVEYINENPPDEEAIAFVIQKCYDKYSRPEPPPAQPLAQVVETRPVLAPEDFELKA